MLLLETIYAAYSYVLIIIHIFYSQETTWSLTFILLVWALPLMAGPFLQPLPYFYVTFALLESVLQITHRSVSCHKPTSLRHYRGLHLNAIEKLVLQSARAILFTVSTSLMVPTCHVLETFQWWWQLAMVFYEQCNSVPVPRTTFSFTQQLHCLKVVLVISGDACGAAWVWSSEDSAVQSPLSFHFL